MFRCASLLKSLHALTVPGVILCLSACGARSAASQSPQPAALAVQGDVAFTHDPSIAKDGNTYYIFATGKASDGGQLPIRCSQDLLHWTLCGHVFEHIPSWIQKRSPGAKELWAPDISFEHGVYRLYYAYSLFGKNTSGIALAINKTLNPRSPRYKWEDKGLVLESKASDNFNAIDPNYIQDQSRHAWLAFGSFWSGIKMRALNAETGLLSSTNTRLYALATRLRPNSPGPTTPGLPPDWEAVEAPFVIHHEGYYYLFVSWDLCCRGTKSTYRTMMGRSRSVIGPYVDETGIPMMQGGGSPLLTANSHWVGPGGESVFQRKEGDDLLVFHAYDAVTGQPSLQISRLAWKNGWPEAALRTK